MATMDKPQNFDQDSPGHFPGLPQVNYGIKAEGNSSVTRSEPTGKLNIGQSYG